MREIVVVFEHDSYEHIGSNQSIYKHEKNDQHFRVENTICRHDFHVDVTKESLEENIEGTHLRSVDLDLTQREAEYNSEDVKKSNLKKYKWK